MAEKSRFYMVMQQMAVPTNFIKLTKIQQNLSSFVLRNLFLEGEIYTQI